MTSQDEPREAAGRLEYRQDGAPATPGKSQFDTAADLLVYCLKCQRYLADQDAGAAVRSFGCSGAIPPYSDCPAGFEALLSRAHLVAVADPARVAELEPCFGQAASAQPVPVRLACPPAMTGAAAVLVRALRREHAQAYARFTSACPAMGEGGAADAR